MASDPGSRRRGMAFGLMATAMVVWTGGSAMALAAPTSASAAPVTSLVSAPENGASGPARTIYFEDASSDGRRVFFTTDESLVAADTDGRDDVYQRSSRETALISAPGEQAQNGSPQAMQFAGASSDGTRVFFTTREKLVGGDTDSHTDVYERFGGQTTLASAPGAGADPFYVDYDVFFAGASSDGTRVFFKTKENLVGSDTDGFYDIYERAGGETTLITVPGVGASGEDQDLPGGGFSFATSSDGTRVFFMTWENLVAADTDGLRDIYERSGGQTTLVSAPGFLANGAPQDVNQLKGVSTEGTRVFFETTERLVGGDTDDHQDVYERSGDQTRLVSGSQAGASGGARSAFFEDASGDGSRVFFRTPENLIGADTDGFDDIYELSGGQTTLASAPGAGASGSAQDYIDFGGISSDGTRVFFTTADNLVGADTDGFGDVYERSGGQTSLVSTDSAQFAQSSRAPRATAREFSSQALKTSSLTIPTD